MLDPAPTTKLPPHLARGLVKEVVPATATKPAYLVVTFANTSYQTHLAPPTDFAPQPGAKVVGVIRAEAKRVDTVGSGGRYVEPVIGRPRRVQGTVVGTDAKANTITVSAGFPIVCKLSDPRQRADQFERGDFVSFDVARGASFTPEA